MAAQGSQRRRGGAGASYLVIAALLLTLTIAPVGLVPGQESRASHGAHPGPLAVESVGPSAERARAVSDDNPAVKQVSVPVGTFPVDAAYDAARGQVFVVNQGSGTVSVISDSTDTVVATVGVGSGPTGIAYDAAQAEVFVANYYSSTVSVISDTTDTVVATVAVGAGPYGLAYDSTAGEVFVSNYASNNVSAISDSTDKVVSNIPVGVQPTALAYDGGKGEIFVTNYGGASPSPGVISVISAATNTVVANVTVGADPSGATYDSAKGEVFVTDGLLGSVSVISDASNSVVTTIQGVDADGWFMTYDPSAGGVLTPRNCCTAGVLSDVSNSLVGNYTVGNNPYGIAYDAGTNQMFTANSGSNNVSVVSLGLVLSAHASPVVGHAPLTVNFSANASGGKYPYSYAWNFGDGSRGTGPSVAHAYVKGGSYVATVFLNDSGGHSLSQSLAVTVHGVPSVSVFATPNPAIFGQPVNFTTSVSGGTPPYTFAWNFGDGGLGGNLSNITHAYTTNGPFEATVTVTDSLGTVGRASLNITIALQASVSANSSGGSVPLDVQFTSLVHGGVPSYTYTWEFGDGARSSSPDPSHTYTTAGDFQARLFVNDTAGHSVQTSWAVAATVHGPTGPGGPPGPSTKGLLGLAGNEGYYLLGGAIVVAGVAVALLAVQLRRSRLPLSGSAEPPTGSVYREAATKTPEVQVTPLQEGETDPASDLF